MQFDIAPKRYIYITCFSSSESMVRSLVCIQFLPIRKDYLNCILFYLSLHKIVCCLELDL